LKFKELGLNEKVLKAIDALGFEEPSQIQEKAIPILLKGKDVIGQAQTGTGKTLAFGAPIINGLKFKNKKIAGIILTPTRELAIQINEALNQLAKYNNAKVIPVYGGQSIGHQISALKRGVDIVVGTPGRVLDLINRRILNLESIDYLVLDEADEMLNMGFIEDIRSIIDNCNEERQTMLFSATMPKEIKRLSKNYMREDREHISILGKAVTVDSVAQYYYEVKRKDRFEVLCRILDAEEPTAAIIFSKTKRGVDELVEKLQVRGYNVEGMHGDMTQNHRTNTLRKFKQGNLEYLIATDVAARGIDVENISHVFNFELPQDIESYIHRIGRTGRAKREGTAVTLVTSREYVMLKQIEKRTKSKIKRKEIPSINDIFHVKNKNILKRVKDTLENEDIEKFVPIAMDLDEQYSLVEVAAALMHIMYKKELSYEYEEKDFLSTKGEIRLFMTVGRMDKLTPKKVTRFLTEVAHIHPTDVGAIDILEKFSFVNIKEEVANKVVKTCNGKKLCGRKMKIEISRKDR